MKQKGKAPIEEQVEKLVKKKTTFKAKESQKEDIPWCIFYF